MEWQVRLVSTDFDGTIFNEFHKEAVALKFQEIIWEFQASGGKWVINTGRDQASLLEELARCKVGVQPDYLVVVEREIHVREETSYRPHESWNARCTQQHEALAESLVDELPALASWIRNHSRASVFSDLHSPLAVVASNNEEMDAIGERVADLMERRTDVSWMRNDVYARICHSDYSKGTALLEIQSMLGIAVEEVFAIGDHLNDIPMLDPEVAGHLAGPANAVPEVRAHLEYVGGRISEYSYGEGAAHELSRLKFSA